MKHIIPSFITVILAASLVGCTHPATQTSLKSLSPQTEATTSTSASVDYQAKFAIFTHGIFRVFTASMYHNLSPNAYIDSAHPNIVKVKKSGITWGHFFNTLPFKLEPDCLITGIGQTFCTEGRDTLKFYVNGQLSPTVLEQEIRAGDQLLVSYGHETEAQIQQELDQLSSL